MQKKNADVTAVDVTRTSVYVLHRVSTANTLDRWSYYLICRILEELTLQLRKWNKALGLTWFVNQKRERESRVSLFFYKIENRKWTNSCLRFVSMLMAV